jgi:hypothetical protein
MTLCALLLYAIYALLLERENMHGFKRVYLLISIIFSMVVPLTDLTINLPTTTENISTLSVGIGNVVEIVESQTFFIEPIVQAEEKPVISSINYSRLFLSVYILITSLFLFRLLKNCRQIIVLGRKNASIDYYGAKIVLINKKSVPHSFGRYIFINREDYVNGRIADEIILHEWTHVHQRHSWDIVFVELLIAFGWFNPIFYLYRNKIRQNHEFLADNAVIQNDIEVVPAYQNILIHQISQNNRIHIVSNFNYLLTQKRIVMMTRITSKKRAWCIISALIPIFIIASCTFSNKSTKPDTETVIDFEQVITRGNGVSPELVTEYQTIVDKYIEKSISGNSDESDKLYWKTAQLQEEDWIRLYTIYVQMDWDQQKEQKIRFGEALHYYDNRKAYPPNKLNYDGWKIDKNCHIRIDGVEVDKSVLNAHKRTDFFAYHVSSLSKGENDFNYRVDFWTEDGFKKFSRQVFEQPVSIGKLLEIRPDIRFVMEQKNDDYVFVSKNHGSSRGWKEASIKVMKNTENEGYSSSSRIRNGGSSPLSYHRNKESGVDKAGDCNCS